MHWRLHVIWFDLTFPVFGLCFLIPHDTNVFLFNTPFQVTFCLFVSIDLFLAASISKGSIWPLCSKNHGYLLWGPLINALDISNHFLWGYNLIPPTASFGNTIWAISRVNYSPSYICGAKPGGCGFWAMAKVLFIWYTWQVNDCRVITSLSVCTVCGTTCNVSNMNF